MELMDNQYVSEKHSNETTREYFSFHNQVIISILMSLVIIFTACGNLLTIVAVRVDRKLRSVSNMYIASLALADLLVGAVVMTFMLLYSVIFNGVWVFGHAVCHLWTLTDYVCCTASLTNVCIIAFDRYKTVAQPLKAIRNRTKRRALHLVLASWGIPVVFWSAILSLLRGLNDQSAPGVCDIIWKPPLLAFTSVVIMVYLPISVILCLFVAMIKVLQGHMKSMNIRMKRTASDKRKKPNQGNPATSERTGGISFNPCYPLASSATEMTTLRPPLQSETSTESGETITSGRSEASFDALIRTPESRLVSVGTNTSTELANLGCRTVGTNTSPQLGMGRDSRGSVPDVVEAHVEVVKQASVDSEEDTCIHVGREDAGPESGSEYAATSGSRSTSVDSNFTFSRSIQLKFRKMSSTMSSDSKVSADSPTWRRYASIMRAERQTVIEKSRLKRQMRAAKTLGLIMTFLLLCWLPFAVLWPVRAVCPHCVSQRVFDISIWINYLNSSINPIIYCLCNPQFRKAFRRFVTRR